MAKPEAPDQSALFDLPTPPEPVIRAGLLPEERVSEAWYDLGGHTHELTEAEARELVRQGLGGKLAQGIVNRANDREFYRKQLGDYSDGDATSYYAGANKPKPKSNR